MLAKPEFLTGWMSPHLLFESTANFSQSEIQFVFRSFGKSPVNSNPGVIISSPGEKFGLEAASVLPAVPPDPTGYVAINM
jgi:hypothetical protein